MGGIVVDIVLVLVATVIFMALLGAVVNRVLAVRIGFTRLVLSGAVGLAAELGFESQFVWGRQEYTPALLPLQIGIIFFVAVAFLVLAEITVPAGSIPRPDRWWPLAVARWHRSRRYAEVSRIALKNRLIPFKPALERTSAAHYERLAQARALRTALEEAGGAFIKLGQVLSTRTDLLPSEFLLELSSLQSSVPAAEWSAIESVLESELGAPVEQVFSSVERDPLATASIGQVHRAVLSDGTPVVVKVQRPGVVPAVERDLDITLRLAQRLERSTMWARDLGVRALAEGFAEALQSELDFHVEERNMVAMALTQSRRPARDRMAVPAPFRALTTKRVLVMEFMSGNTLSSRDAESGFSPEQRREQAESLLSSVLAQILDDGVFHADLHPGNVVVRESGRLGMLDFGSVGRLDSQSRSQIGEVLLALQRDDTVGFTDALLAMVDLPEDVDEPGLRRAIAEFMALHLGPGATLDVAVVSGLVTLLGTYRITVPPELGLVFRAVGTVEGTLRQISPEFDLLASATAMAKARMAKSLAPKAVFTSINDEVAAVLPLLRRLPRRIDRLTETISDGRLSTNIRLFAHQQDRSAMHALVSVAALAFLSGTFAIVAAMLLVSGAGPQITPTLSLFQVFGYLVGIIAGILTLRVLFDAFRLRGRE